MSKDIEVKNGNVSEAFKEIAEKSVLNNIEKEEYKCAVCKEVYNKAWPDIAADYEAQELWGVVGASKKEDMAIVCDDCFKRLPL